MRLPLIMKRALTVLSGPLLLSLPAAAQQRAHPMPPMDFTEAPRITAQMIVDSFRPPPGIPRQWADRHQADGYLRAARDLLPVRWCPHPRLPMHEVDGEIVGYLANLSPTARQGDAAHLIADALVAKFPCSKRKER